MKRAHFVALVFTSLIPASAFAAGPAPAEKPGQAAKPAAAATAAAEPVIPKRELQFDESEEERPVKLFAADPKLLELRYVATFRVQLLRDGLREFRNIREFRDVDPSGYGKRADLFKYYLGVQRRGGLTGKEVWRALAGSIPAEKLPSHDVVAALTNEADCNIATTSKPVEIVWREDDASKSMPRSGVILEYQILAPTAQRAKELVRGMVSLYEWGIFRPIEEKVLAEKKTGEDRLPEMRARSTKLQEEIKDLEARCEKLKDVETISDETLNGLMTQQRLMSVDVDGVKARIEACKKLREQAVPRREQELDNLLVTAEIDLAGLEARQNSIKEIIDRARLRRELLEKTKAVQQNRKMVEQSIRQVELDNPWNPWILENLRFFPLDNGKVEIRRVKWEPVKEEKAK